MNRADLASVRAVLDRDRIWTIYALGDLDPRRAGHCCWYVDAGSVALLYHEFSTPIVFAAGEPSILRHVDRAGPLFLQVPEHFRGPVSEQYQLDWMRPMHRMGLDPAAFRRPPATGNAGASPLRGGLDEAALRELYLDGRETGEEPDFFLDSQLEDDTFFGVWDVDGRLISAGGTHLFSLPESVAAIGNVYTRRDQRGKGLARAVTAAIVENVLDRGIHTIALNVKSQNIAAIRIYEQLGFRLHCPYWEAFAQGEK